MASYDCANIEKSAREAGVTAFISKPLFLTEMHDVLARAIGVLKDEVKIEVDDTSCFAGKKILLVEDNESVTLWTPYSLHAIYCFDR